MQSTREVEVGIPLETGIELRGIMHLPAAEPEAGVLICHGMLSYKDSPKHQGLARSLSERGLAVLRFDFQGRGESPGDLMELSFSRQVDEAKAALDRLAAQSGVRRFGLVGSSMGGAVAILLAGSGIDGLDALVSYAAVGRPGKLGPRLADAAGLALWRARGWLEFEGERIGHTWLEDASRTDVLRAAARVRAAWLILHGERDEVVPVEEARALHLACPEHSRLEILAGADHRFSSPEHLAELMERSVQFLLQRLMPRIKP